MELNYKSAGSGEPVIILHGLFGMLDNWQSVALDLSADFEVFTLDMRNHGRSPHDPVHSYMAMAYDLLGFMQEQNIFSAHLVGHSMGGNVAIQFAAVYPGYIKKMVVVDMFPRRYLRHEKASHLEVFRAIDHIEKSAFYRRSDAEYSLKELIHDDRTRLFIYKNLKILPDGRIGWKFNAEALKNNYAALLEPVTITDKISVPVLFIKGGKSDYITEQDIAGMENLFTHASVITFPDAGHWVHADAGKAFQTAVKKFLKD